MNFPKSIDEDENDDDSDRITTSGTIKLKLAFPTRKFKSKFLSKLISDNLKTASPITNNENNLNEISISPTSTVASTKLSSENSLELITLFEPKVSTVTTTIETQSQLNFDDMLELSNSSADDEDLNTNISESSHVTSTATSTSELEEYTMNKENLTTVPVELLSVTEETQNPSEKITLLASSDNSNEKTEKSDEFGVLETLSLDQDLEETPKTTGFQITSTSSTTLSNNKILYKLASSKAKNFYNTKNNENDDVPYSTTENLSNDSKFPTEFSTSSPDANDAQTGSSALNLTESKLGTWPELTYKISDVESKLNLSSAINELAKETQSNMNSLNPELKPTTTHMYDGKDLTTLNKPGILTDGSSLENQFTEITNEEVISKGIGLATVTHVEENKEPLTNENVVSELATITIHTDGNKDLVTSNEFLTTSDLTTTLDVSTNYLIRNETKVNFATLSKEDETVPTKTIGDTSSKVTSKVEISSHILTSTHDIFDELEPTEIVNNEDMVPGKPISTTQVDILPPTLKSTSNPFIETEATAGEDMIPERHEKTIFTSLEENNGLSTSSEHASQITTSAETLPNIVIVTTKSPQEHHDAFKEFQVKETDNEDMVPTEPVSTTEIEILSQFLTTRSNPFIENVLKATIGEDMIPQGPEKMILTDLEKNKELLTSSEHASQIATSSGTFPNTVTITTELSHENQNAFNEFRVTETINEDMILTKLMSQKGVEILPQTLETTHNPFMENVLKVTFDEDMISHEPEEMIVTNLEKDKELLTSSEHASKITAASDTLSSILIITTEHDNLHAFNELQTKGTTNEDTVPTEPTSTNEVEVLPQTLETTHNNFIENALKATTEKDMISQEPEKMMVTNLEKNKDLLTSSQHASQITSSPDTLPNIVAITTELSNDNLHAFNELQIKGSTNEDMGPAKPISTNDVEILPQTMETTHNPFIENSLKATTDEDMISQEPEKTIVTNLGNDKDLLISSEHASQITTSPDTLPNIIAITTELSTDNLHAFNELQIKGTTNEEMGPAKPISTNEVETSPQTLETTHNPFIENALKATTDEDMISQEPEKMIVTNLETNKDLLTSIQHASPVTTSPDTLPNIVTTTIELSNDNLHAFKELQIKGTTNEDMGPAKPISTKEVETSPQTLETTHNPFIENALKATTDEDMISQEPEKIIVTNLGKDKDLLISSKHASQVTTSPDTLPNIVTTTIELSNDNLHAFKELQIKGTTNEDMGPAEPISTNDDEILPQTLETTHNPFIENELKATTDEDMNLQEQEKTINNTFEENKGLPTSSEFALQITTAVENKNMVWPDLSTTVEIAPHTFTKTTSNFYNKFLLKDATTNEDMAPIETHSTIAVTILPQILKTANDITSDGNMSSKEAELASTIAANNELSVSNAKITNAGDMLKNKHGFISTAIRAEGNQDLAAIVNELVTLTEGTARSENFENISTTKSTQETHFKGSADTNLISNVLELTEIATHAEESKNMITQELHISKSTHNIFENFHGKETADEDMVITEPEYSTVVSILPQISNITPNLFLENEFKKITNHEDMGSVSLEAITSVTSANEHKSERIQTTETRSKFSSFTPNISNGVTAPTITWNTHTFGLVTSVETIPHLATTTFNEIKGTKFGGTADTHLISSKSTVSFKTLEPDTKKHSNTTQNNDFSSNYNVRSSVNPKASHEPSSGATTLTSNSANPMESSSLNQEQSTRSDYKDNTALSALSSSHPLEENNKKLTSKLPGSKNGDWVTRSVINSTSEIVSTLLTKLTSSKSVNTETSNFNNATKIFQDVIAFPTTSAKSSSKTSLPDELGVKSNQATIAHLSSVTAEGNHLKDLTSKLPTEYEDKLHSFKPKDELTSNSANAIESASLNKKQSTAYKGHTESTLLSQNNHVQEDNQTSRNSEELTSKIPGDESGFVSWPEFNSTSENVAESSLLTKVTSSESVNAGGSFSNNVTEIFQDIIAFSTTATESSSETSPSLPDELKNEFKKSTIEHFTNLELTSKLSSDNGDWVTWPEMNSTSVEVSTLLTELTSSELVSTESSDSNSVTEIFQDVIAFSTTAAVSSKETSLTLPDELTDKHSANLSQKITTENSFQSTEMSQTLNPLLTSEGYHLENETTFTKSGQMTTELNYETSKSIGTDVATNTKLDVEGTTIPEHHLTLPDEVESDMNSTSEQEGSTTINANNETDMTKTFSVSHKPTLLSLDESSDEKNESEAVTTDDFKKTISLNQTESASIQSSITASEYETQNAGTLEITSGFSTTTVDHSIGPTSTNSQKDNYTDLTATAKSDQIYNAHSSYSQEVTTNQMDFNNKVQPTGADLWNNQSATEQQAVITSTKNFIVGNQIETTKVSITTGNDEIKGSHLDYSQIFTSESQNYHTGMHGKNQTDQYHTNLMHNLAKTTDTPSSTLLKSPESIEILSHSQILTAESGNRLTSIIFSENNQFSQTSPSNPLNLTSSHHNEQLTNSDNVQNSVSETGKTDLNSNRFTTAFLTTSLAMLNRASTIAESIYNSVSHENTNNPVITTAIPHLEVLDEEFAHFSTTSAKANITNLPNTSSIVHTVTSSGELTKTTFLNPEEVLTKHSEIIQSSQTTPGSEQGIAGNESRHSIHTEHQLLSTENPEVSESVHIASSTGNEIVTNSEHKFSQSAEDLAKHSEIIQSDHSTLGSEQGIGHSGNQEHQLLQTVNPEFSESIHSSSTVSNNFIASSIGNEIVSNSEHKFSQSAEDLAKHSDIIQSGQATFGSEQGISHSGNQEHLPLSTVNPEFSESIHSSITVPTNLITSITGNEIVSNSEHTFSQSAEDLAKHSDIIQSGQTTLGSEQGIAHSGNQEHQPLSTVNPEFSKSIHSSFTVPNNFVASITGNKIESNSEHKFSQSAEDLAKHSDFIQNSQTTLGSEQGISHSGNQEHQTISTVNPEFSESIHSSITFPTNFITSSAGNEIVSNSEHKFSQSVEDLAKHSEIIQSGHSTLSSEQGISHSENQEHQPLSTVNPQLSESISSFTAQTNFIVSSTGNEIVTNSEHKFSQSAEELAKHSEIIQSGHSTLGSEQGKAGNELTHSVNVEHQYLSTTVIPEYSKGMHTNFLTPTNFVAHSTGSEATLNMENKYSQSSEDLAKHSESVQSSHSIVSSNQGLSANDLTHLRNTEKPTLPTVNTNEPFSSPNNKNTFLPSTEFTIYEDLKKHSEHIQIDLTTNVPKLEILDEELIQFPIKGKLSTVNSTHLPASTEFTTALLNSQNLISSNGLTNLQDTEKPTLSTLNANEQFSPPNNDKTFLSSTEFTMFEDLTKHSEHIQIDLTTNVPKLEILDEELIQFPIKDKLSTVNSTHLPASTEFTSALENSGSLGISGNELSHLSNTAISEQQIPENMHTSFTNLTSNIHNTPLTDNSQNVHTTLLINSDLSDNSLTPVLNTVTLPLSTINSEQHSLDNMHTGLSNPLTNSEVSGNILSDVPSSSIQSWSSGHTEPQVSDNMQIISANPTSNIFHNTAISENNSSIQPSLAGGNNDYEITDNMHNSVTNPAPTIIHTTGHEAISTEIEANSIRQSTILGNELLNTENHQLTTTNINNYISSSFQTSVVAPISSILASTNNESTLSNSDKEISVSTEFTVYQDITKHSITNQIDHTTVVPKLEILDEELIQLPIKFSTEHTAQTYNTGISTSSEIIPNIHTTPLPHMEISGNPLSQLPNHATQSLSSDIVGQQISDNMHTSFTSSTLNIIHSTSLSEESQNVYTTPLANVGISEQEISHPSNTATQSLPGGTSEQQISDNMHASIINPTSNVIHSTTSSEDSQNIHSTPLTSAEIPGQGISHPSNIATPSLSGGNTEQQISDNMHASIMNPVSNVIHSTTSSEDSQNIHSTPLTNVEIPGQEISHPSNIATPSLSGGNTEQQISDNMHASIMNPVSNVIHSTTSSEDSQNIHSTPLTNAEIPGQEISHPSNIATPSLSGGLSEQQISDHMRSSIIYPTSNVIHGTSSEDSQNIHTTPLTNAGILGQETSHLSNIATPSLSGGNNDQQISDNMHASIVHPISNVVHSTTSSEDNQNIQTTLTNSGIPGQEISLPSNTATPSLSGGLSEQQISDHMRSSIIYPTSNVIHGTSSEDSQNIHTTPLTNAGILGQETSHLSNIATPSLSGGNNEQQISDNMHASIVHPISNVVHSTTSSEDNQNIHTTLTNSGIPGQEISLPSNTATPSLSGGLSEQQISDHMRSSIINPTSNVIHGTSSEDSQNIHTTPLTNAEIPGQEISHLSNIATPSLSGGNSEQQISDNMHASIVNPMSNVAHSTTSSEDNQNIHTTLTNAGFPGQEISLPSNIATPSLSGGNSEQHISDNMHASIVNPTSTVVHSTSSSEDSLNMHTTLTNAGFPGQEISLPSNIATPSLSSGNTEQQISDNIHASIINPTSNVIHTTTSSEDSQNIHTTPLTNAEIPGQEISHPSNNATPSLSGGNTEQQIPDNMHASITNPTSNIIHSTGHEVVSPETVAETPDLIHDGHTTSVTNPALSNENLTESTVNINDEHIVSNSTHTVFITPTTYTMESIGSGGNLANSDKDILKSTEFTIYEDITKHTVTNEFDHSTIVPKLEILDEELFQLSSKSNLFKNTTQPYLAGTETVFTTLSKVIQNVHSIPITNLEISGNVVSHIPNRSTQSLININTEQESPVNIHNGFTNSTSSIIHPTTLSENSYDSPLTNIGIPSNELSHLPNTATQKWSGENTEQQILNRTHTNVTNPSTASINNAGNKDKSHTKTHFTHSNEDLSKHSEVSENIHNTLNPYLRTSTHNILNTKNQHITDSNTDLTNLTTSIIHKTEGESKLSNTDNEFQNSTEFTVYEDLTKHSETIQINHTTTVPKLEILDEEFIQIPNKSKLFENTTQITNHTDLTTLSIPLSETIALPTITLFETMFANSNNEQESTNLFNTTSSIFDNNTSVYIKPDEKETITTEHSLGTKSLDLMKNNDSITKTFNHNETLNEFLKTLSTLSEFQTSESSNTTESYKDLLNKNLNSFRGWLGNPSINDTDQTTILANESTLTVKTNSDITGFSTNISEVGKTTAEPEYFSTFTHSLVSHFQNTTNGDSFHTPQQNLTIGATMNTKNGAEQHHTDPNQEQGLDQDHTLAPVTNNQEILSSVIATLSNSIFTSESSKSKTEPNQNLEHFSLKTHGEVITDHHVLGNTEVPEISTTQKIVSHSDLTSTKPESESIKNLSKIQNESSGNDLHIKNKNIVTNGSETSNLTTDNLKNTGNKTEDDLMWNWPEMNSTLSSNLHGSATHPANHNGVVNMENSLTGDHTKITQPDITFASPKFEPAENDILFTSKPNLSTTELPISSNLVTHVTHPKVPTSTMSLISKSEHEGNKNVPPLEIKTVHHPEVGNTSSHKSNGNLPNAPIYINLPVYPVDSTFPLLLKFNEYYSSTTTPSIIIDDEATDRVINIEEFRTMKLEDFNFVTEFPATTIIMEASSIAKLSNTNQVSNDFNHLTTKINQALKDDHIEHNHQTAVGSTTNSEVTHKEKAQDKLNEVLNEYIHQNQQNAELTTKSDTVHISTTEEKINHMISNGVTELLTLGSSLGMGNVENAGGSEEVNKTSELGVLNVTEHSPPVMIISEFPKFQEESTCNYTDYLSQNNCMCSMDNLIKDLRMKLVNNFLNFSIDNFTCPIFTHVEAGIFLGNDSVPQISNQSVANQSLPSKTRRDVNDMYSIIVRREIVEYQNMDKTLNEQLELKNTENDIFATPGMKILIPCNSANNLSEGSTNYSWTFSDNLPLTEGKIQETEGSLTIDNVAPQDAGNYTCIATSTNANKSNDVKYEHHLSVVSIPSYRLQTTLLYNSTEKCQSGDADIISLYLPNALEGLICGNYFKVCSIQVKNPKCVNATQYTSVNLTVVIEPINVIMPAINNSVCDVSCEMKIYTHVVLFIIKNLEAVLKLPVFFRLSYRQQKLMPTEVVIKKTKQKLGTEAPKLIITCPPGFGYYKKTHVCGTCGRNTFSRGDETFCSPCPAGQYQPMVGSKSCLVCATPLQDPYCLRVMYSNTHKFRVLIGITVTIVVVIFILLLCLKNMRKSTNSRSNTKFGRESYLKSKRQASKRRIRDPDVEMQDSQPLLDSSRGRRKSYHRKPPEPPPPDFY